MSASGSGGNANRGGSVGNGGSITSAGSAPTGTGGMLGSAAGTSSQAGSGSAGDLGACFGSDIDVPSVALSGAIKLLDTTPGNYGTVLLTSGSDLVTLGTTASSTYSVRIVPGTYDLVMRDTQNGVHRFKSGVTVPSSGPAVLDIEIPATALMAPWGAPHDPATITLSGKLTIDGIDRPENRGLVLSVRKLGTDAQVEFARTTSNTFSGLISPGSYDVFGLNTGGNAILPGWGYEHVLSMGLVVPNTDPAQLDIDVRTATVSGAITFDGAVAQCNAGLRSARAGGLSFGLDSAGAFSGRVLPETYDVVYQPAASRMSPCPMNTATIIKRGLVVSAAGLTIPTIDVSTVAVSGKLTLGGAALSNPDDDGSLYLRTDEGDEIFLAKLSNGTFSIRVIPGTYDLYFDVAFQQVAKLAPLNRRGKIKSVVFAPGAPIALDIDVPSTIITGTVKVGGSYLDKELDGGRLWLGDPQSTIGIPFAWTSAGKYSARVLPGTYDLFYQGTSPSALAPMNTSAKLGCMVVQ
ncbi:MAG TPA: hypothetical protein VER96_14710 [Polyangiaceae bacterium]|nr:hypothetical protein [Polyangiaceae bacterium]